MQILWIRHGRTQGNIERRYVGRTDERLTADAKAILQDRKQRFWDLFSKARSADERKKAECFWPELVYTSPMVRCRETAGILFPGQEAVIWEGLQETDFGDFEYKNYEELKDDPAYQAWIDSNGELPIPNGESGLDFRQRCCNAYERCIAAAKAQSREKIAIVCHGGTIMSVMERYGVPQKSFYEWQISNGCGILTELIEGEKKGYGMREISKWE